MYCRWCGSEILEDTKFCPHCGELLRDEEEVTPERDRAELEEEIEGNLYTFFSKNINSAFSMNALKNRLNEIVTDYGAKEYFSQHLKEILHKMIQKGYLESSYHNNEIHYHIVEPAVEEPHKQTSEMLRKLHDAPSLSQDIIKEPIKPPRVKSAKSQAEGRIAALVITGIIGLILLLVGVTQIYNNYMISFSFSSLTPGITMTIIGIIVLFVVIGIATKGSCFGDCFCDCDDCCCDAC